MEESGGETDDDDDLSPEEAAELEAWFNQELGDDESDSLRGTEVEDDVTERVVRDYMDISSYATSFEELTSRSGRLLESEEAGDNFPPIDDAVADIDQFGFCWSDACAVSCERSLVLGARWANLYQRGLVPCSLEGFPEYGWLSWPLPGHEELLIEEHRPIFYLFHHDLFCKAFLLSDDGVVEDVSVVNADAFSALKVGGVTFQLFSFLRNWVNLELLQACSSEGFFRGRTSVEERLRQPERPYHLSDEFQSTLAVAVARSSARQSRQSRLAGTPSPEGEATATALVNFHQDSVGSPVAGSSGSGGEGRRRRLVLDDEKGKGFKSGAKKLRRE